jgi:PKD repeat protein
VIGGIEPYTISWNFGDGSVQSDEDDETVEHTFDVAGTYNVDLTVTDSTGTTESDSILITVEAATPSPSPSPSPLIAVDIISDGTEGIAPATFVFQAEVTGGTEPYTYSWDFGDGSGEGNEQTVLHTFDVAGTYNVDVIVTDSTGTTGFDSILITVEEALETEEPLETEGSDSDIDGL